MSLCYDGADPSAFSSGAFSGSVASVFFAGAFLRRRLAVFALASASIAFAFSAFC
jgi:hypothetical protein